MEEDNLKLKRNVLFEMMWNSVTSIGFISWKIIPEQHGLGKFMNDLNGTCT
jgi:hypothetical protein